MAGTMRTRDLSSFQKATMENLEHKHIQNKTIRSVKNSKLSIVDVNNIKSRGAAAKPSENSSIFFKQAPKITIKKSAIQKLSQPEDEIPPELRVQYSNSTNTT